MKTLTSFAVLPLALTASLLLPWSTWSFSQIDVSRIKHYASKKTDVVLRHHNGEKALIGQVSSSETKSSESLPFVNEFNRRTFVSTLLPLITSTSLIIASPSIARAENESTPTPPRVLVLGGSGFVGSQVCATLRTLSIPYTATSRSGREGTVAFDVASPGINVPETVASLAAGYTSVISCMGSIGTDDDFVVNAASGLAAVGAQRAGVKRFVYVGVAPDVKEATKGFGFLKGYMAGKDSSVGLIRDSFGGGSDDTMSYTIINPTFIYGGDKFGINPPRVASGYGNLVEGLLSTGVFRAAAGVTPGLISVALEPPVKVEDVAAAAVAGALGAVKGSLDTYDDIVAAAKKNVVI